jgi:hypothetical protein
VSGALRSRDRPESILYVTALGFALIWPISHRVTLLTSQRARAAVYLVPIAPVLALIGARVASTDLRSAVIVLLAGVASVITLHRMDVWARTDSYWPPDTPRSLSPLTAALDRMGVRYAYANYWIAYRLWFDADERIVATQYPYTKLTQDRHWRLVPLPNPPARYPPWQREVEKHKHAFIVFRRYVRHNVGPFAVYARR